MFASLMENMDFPILGIFILSLCLCTGFVFFVSVFGAREQSFEDALEEKKRKLNAERKKPGQQPSSSTSAAAAQSLPTTTTTSLPSKKEKKGKWGKKKSSSNASQHDEEVETVEVPCVSHTEIFAPKKVEKPVTEEVIVKERKAPKGKSNRKSMVIEEVEETEVKKVEVSSVKKQSVEKMKNTAEPNNGKITTKDVLSVLKKMPMDDTECQYLIDTLLNKQVGNHKKCTSEWVETSAGSSGNASSIKNLQKKLADKEVELEEANSRAKSTYDRMMVLRQELNSSKILNANSQRLSDDVRISHQRELNALQGRLQHQIDTQHREVTNLQGQLQIQIKRTQQLEANISQLSSQTTIDPSLFNEMRAAKESSQSQVSALQSAIGHEQDEKNQLKIQVNQAQNTFADMEQKHVQLLEEMNTCRSTLDETYKSLESYKYQNQVLQEKADGLMLSKSDNEKKLQDLSMQIDLSAKNLSESNKQVSRISEENERLSEQLASAVERPKAEGQEAGAGTNGDINGHDILNMKEDVGSWHNKYVSLHEEKEMLMNENKLAVSELQTQLEKTKECLAKVTNDLDHQKTKNDELRTKNWKAVEALNNAEQKLKKQPQSDDVDVIVSKVKTEMDTSQKELLRRLFPEVKSPNNKDHAAWLANFEETVKKHCVKNSAPSTESLEKQVTHYQSVLAETENMLKALQTGVESEEVLWKQRLTDKEAELEAVTMERDLFIKKNSALDESLLVVRQAEEMQLKLQELQQKLETEELEKARIVLELSNVRKEHEKCNDFLQEVTRLKDLLDDERKQKDDLAARLVKMNQVMSTVEAVKGQETTNHSSGLGEEATK